MLAAVCLLAATATLPAVPNWNVFYPYCRLVSVFGGKYFPNRSSLFVFILFTEMVACDKYKTFAGMMTVSYESHESPLSHVPTKVICRNLELAEAGC